MAAICQTELILTSKKKNLNGLKKNFRGEGSIKQIKCILHVIHSAKGQNCIDTICHALKISELLTNPKLGKILKK